MKVMGLHDAPTPVTFNLLQQDLGTTVQVSLRENVE
jgi:hypothetical protein